MSRFILRPGESVGPCFLKFYVPGDCFVLFSYWPLLNRKWWWLLWQYTRARHYAMVKWHLTWTAIHIHCFVWYITFSVPVWFYPRAQTMCVNKIGYQRGPCWLIVRAAFRVWPFWQRLHGRSFIEVLKYPLRDRQEYIGHPDFPELSWDAMEDLR